VPRPRELRELSHRGTVGRRECGASRRSGPRRGRAARASGAGEPHARVQGKAWVGGEFTSLVVRDLPRPFDLSRLSSSRRHATSRLPPSAVSHAAPKLRVRAGGELQRLPQPGAVLPELPPAVRSRRDVATWPGRLSRRLSKLQPRPRPGGTPEPRVMRRLPCGARLHDVPFRGERRVQVQPSWARVQRRSDAVEERIAVHRLSRQLDSERPLMPP